MVNVPAQVHVVQLIVPRLVSVPEVYVAAPEQFRLVLTKSTLPLVCVYVVQKSVGAMVHANVVVPE